MLFFHVLFSNFYSVIDGMTVEAYQSAVTFDVTAERAYSPKYSYKLSIIYNNYRRKNKQD